MMKFKSWNYRLAELNKNTECSCAAVSCSSTNWILAPGDRVQDGVNKGWGGGGSVNGNHLNI